MSQQIILQFVRKGCAGKSMLGNKYPKVWLGQYGLRDNEQISLISRDDQFK